MQWKCWAVKRLSTLENFVCIEGQISVHLHNWLVTALSGGCRQFGCVMPFWTLTCFHRLFYPQPLIQSGSF